MTKDIWTDDDLLAEWSVHYRERLGAICADMPPTPAEDTQARKEADEWVARVREKSTILLLYR